MNGQLVSGEQQPREQNLCEQQKKIKNILAT
jgi:hypothetical protein